MLAIERRNGILEKLQNDRKVVVSDLSAIYKVSEETIRRDLEKLEADGYAIKSYGGAVINENFNVDLPFNIRKNRNVIGKKKIANIIRNMISDGERITLDASSTVVAVAKVIKDKKDLTILTNSLEISVELLDSHNCTVISTGGTISGKSFALVGPLADRAINSYYTDKAIISCKGLDISAGLTDSDERHANNKFSMLRCAKQKILAVDSSKFNQIAFSRICQLNEIDVVVTDVKPSPEWLDEFNKLGIICIYE